MKNQTRMNLMIILVVGIALAFFSINATAGSIRCGGTIIDDGDRRGISKLEVEKKCGTPYSKYGNSWIYSMPNGTVTRIRFKSNGEVSSITNERI